MVYVRHHVPINPSVSYSTILLSPVTPSVQFLSKVVANFVLPEEEASCNQPVKSPSRETE